MTTRRGMQLSAAWIAVAAGLVPLLAFHAGWLISMANGSIEAGFPYLDGSTSISRACRKEPAVHLFRGLVLPSAPFVGLTWVLCASWLGATGRAGPRTCRWVRVLGVVAALFLVLYATFLGTEGDVYRWMRRYGVYVFFSGTAVTELIVTIVLTRARPASLAPRVRRAMWAICWLMLAAGPVNLVAGKLVEKDTVADLLEWWFTLGMVGYPLLLARVWRVEGLRLELGSATRDPGQ